MASGSYAPPASGPPSSGQPPRVLAAWIREALQELKSEHISGLSGLVGKLATETSAWGGAFLIRAIDAMLDAARQLDPGALRPQGLWQRFTGSRANQARHFQLRLDELLSAAAKVNAQIDALGRGYQASTSNVRKLVVELEMVQRAIASNTEEAVDWLGELAGHLTGQGGESPNAGASKFATAAQDSTAELKAILATNDLLGNVIVASRNVLDRRVALLERAKQDMQGFEKAWRPKVSRVAAKAVGDGSGNVPAGLDDAEAIHAELLRRLESTSGDGVALQLEELGLERLVARMTEKLGSSFTGS